MVQRVQELKPGVWHFQAELWQVNSLVVLVDGQALICDPGLTPEDLQSIRAKASEASGDRYLLLTHSDFDHTCGLSAFPEAVIVSGAATAELIETGNAAERLRAAATEWNIPWSAELRVDRVVSSGDCFDCGRFTVAAIAAGGHKRDGLAYVLVDQSVLLPGDYLSRTTFPFVAYSLKETRRTEDRLLGALDEYEPEWVVPGHGPPLSASEARAVAHEDLAYLDSLAEAADRAIQQRLSQGRALLASYAVEPPRVASLDFQVYGHRTLNAKRALAEAQERSP